MSNDPQNTNLTRAERDARITERIGKAYALDYAAAARLPLTDALRLLEDFILAMPAPAATTATADGTNPKAAAVPPLRGLSLAEAYFAKRNAEAARARGGKQ